MEGKGILLHKHSVALVDGEAKSPDPSILRYGEIAINYATDHETISIKNQNDEIATFKTHKLYTQLLGDKQDKTDDTLLTQDKTVVGALNELKTDLDDSVEPYVVNLTNLLSANDSESISSAIGGIENLNSTISKNQVIFGVLATGTVAVGIRVFGNQTTLNYFVDSVLGLTINEIAITNTDNTLSKTVETHAVLTENMVINSLNSDETTLPLSAAQGKALDNEITTLQTNLNTKQNSTDNNLDTTDKTITGAINELKLDIDNKVTGVGKIDPNSDGTGEVFNDYTNNKATGVCAHAEGSATTATGIYAHAEGFFTIASRPFAHAEGSHTTASGQNAHAEGNGTIASGQAAHAEGWVTTASGSHAHAEGDSTTASGFYTHAEGQFTTASGSCAHAEGYNTIAYGDYAHAEGQYNFDDSSAIHMVGIGTSDTDRRNAHEIKHNGDHYVYGVGGFDGTNSDTAQSLQEVINSKQATVIDVSTLFADSATTTSELSSQIAAYGESTATDFPLMYAGPTIGNIKPTWIRTSAGVTNFMCIADNKIWYFEIEGTTVQRASLAIS